MSFVDDLAEVLDRPATRTAKSRQMAHDHRIYCFAENQGWDVTPAEISDGLRISINSVYGTLRRRGWAARVRSSTETSSQSGLAGADEISKRTEFARVSVGGLGMMAAE